MRCEGEGEGQPSVGMSEPHLSSCSANIKISYLVSSLAAPQRGATVNVCSLNYMINIGEEHKS